MTALPHFEDPSIPDVIKPGDAELRVGIDDRFGSMGEEPYLVYEMRVMRYKENNEYNKQHDDECERPMNDSKGG